MVAYSFKAMFRPPILTGTKRQTIRADRKRHARPGEQVQLYTGMRTLQCQMIGTATCVAANPVSLAPNAGWVDYLDTRLVRGYGIEEFARSDGFTSWDDMREFWCREHPSMPVFSGVLIRWAAFVPGRST